MGKNRLLVINDHETTEITRRIVIVLAGKKLICHESIDEAKSLIAETINQIAVEKNNKMINFGAN